MIHTETNKAKEFFKKAYNKMLETEKKIISNSPLLFVLLILVSLLSGAFVGKKISQNSN
jgi:hypothetical protein